VINVVTGLGKTAGAALANHPCINRFSFTGSPEVGRLIGEACGRNLVPAKLELGVKGLRSSSTMPPWKRRPKPWSLQSP